MRRAIKGKDSKVLQDGLIYISGNSLNNALLRDILLAEQKSFCAYTDEYISRTDAKDIEHFNPTLKGTDQDGYSNWFVVKHQWNKEKSYKWEEFQPVLYPVDDNFNNRIIYYDGDYISGPDDVEAKNLIRLLKLDDPSLADKRKKYINRKRKEIEMFGVTPESYFLILISDNICQISYVRALSEEFSINLWELLP